MHGIEKRIVYIVRSDVDPSRHDVGITNDLRARLEWHNDGPGTLHEPADRACAESNGPSLTVRIRH